MKVFNDAAEIAAAGAGTPVDPSASTGTSSESRTTATSDGAVPRRATASPRAPASAGPPPREPCCFTGALAGAEPEASRGEVSEDADEPAEPVLSAHAVAGNAAITPPTPNATANAPTRPTYRAEVDAAEGAETRRPNSMGRTWPIPPATARCRPAPDERRWRATGMNESDALIYEPHQQSAKAEKQVFEHFLTISEPVFLISAQNYRRSAIKIVM